MAEVSSDQLSPQQLIAKHRRTYFFMQMRMLILSAIVITIAAQLFVGSQALAMVIAALAVDAFRVLDGVRLYRLTTGTWYGTQLRTLTNYFFASTPRRWLEYALLVLPANAALTFLLHGDANSEFQNLGTYTLAILGDAVGMVAGEVSDLKAGLASLTVDFGVVGLLEYIAARWLFSKRKLIFKEKT